MSAPADVVPDQRQATLDLVAATRELMLATATSRAPVEELRRVEQEVRQLSAELNEHASPRVLRTPFDLPAQIRAAGPNTPWQMFEQNPIGFPLEVSLDGDTATGRLVANALHEGPHDSLHGGLSAHIMDCILGGLVQSTGVRAVTATLTVRYRNKAPLDQPLDLGARITRVDGRKIHTEGWIEHDGKRCVEATGLFIVIDAQPR